MLRHDDGVDMETNKTHRTLLTTCIVASVAVHLCVLMGSGIYMTYFKKVREMSQSQRKPALEQKVKQAMAEIKVSFPELSPALIAQFKKQVEQDPEKDKEELKKEVEQKIEEVEESETQVILSQDTFERTSAAQASDKTPEKTHLYGVRDTVAKSDTAATKGAPNRIAVSGETPRSAIDRDIIQEKFRDGDPLKSGGGEKAPVAGDPEAEKLSKLIDKDFQKVIDRLSGKKPTEQSKSANENRKVEDSKVLDFGKAVAHNSSSVDNAEQVMKSRKLEADKLKEQSGSSRKPQKLVNASKGQKVKSKIQDPFLKSKGMSSNIRKNRMTGSLSTRGSVASKNVRGTPLGEYENAVLRSVEKQWQKKIAEKPHFFQPGSFFAIFYVNERGQVKNCRFEEVPRRMTTLQGFTFQAIKDATIPSMPRKVRELMQGNPAEMRIHFNF